MRLRWLLLSFFLVGGTLAPRPGIAEVGRAGLVWMNGKSIGEAFSGKTLKGLYPNGNLWVEVIHADSRTDYREGAKHWNGNWWVTDKEFCFAYPPPGVGGCFRVTKISANCYELYDFSGEAAHLPEPPFIGDRWNGRMWYEERPTTCEEKPSS